MVEVSGASTELILRWTRRGSFVCYGSASRHDPFSGLPPLVRLLLLRTSSSDYVHKLDCAFAPRCRPIFRTHPPSLFCIHLLPFSFYPWGRHARHGTPGRARSATLHSPPCPFPTHAVKQDRGGRSVRCLNRADPTMDTKRKLRVLRVSLEARSLLRVAPSCETTITSNKFE